MAKTQKTTAFIDDTIRKTVAGDFKGIDDVFSHLLNPIFGEDNFTRGTDELIRSNPEYRKMAELTHIQSIFHRGSFDVNGNALQIYEIVMDDHSQLRRARSGIQTIVRKFFRRAQSALIVFHYKNPQGRSWRLSYVIHDKSTAKRYTYLLGQKHPTRTAAKQLSSLMKNKQLVTDDILKAFSVETLTEEFYTQIKDWYVWAQKEQFNVTFPNDVGTAQDDRQHLEEHLIRLITRLIFVWFIKQKGLAADELFEPAELKNMLVDFDAEAGKGGTGCRPQCEKTSSYYNAILQNLFFATLNKAMDKRGFAYDGTDPVRRREEYGIKTLYRYRSQFTDSGAESVLQHFKKTPFLNGGLFECLDKSDPMADNPNRIIYSDGFSRNDKKNDGNFACRAFIPNVLFFSRNEKQPGIIEILKRYHFTIEENSDDDAVVALDPELLGKIFENLLAYYNPETKDTVKKSTGSFYTPREIVRFMTESSIASYLKSKCPDMQDKIDLLFTDEWEAECLKASQRKGITEALLSMKTLDPACGSGAFPMGMMQVMLELLQKLDPDVVNHLYEYKKKIIENCLYGVDIQTIAVQITKLRCFISLTIDSEPDPDADNLGITPLLNLETNFVAANSLIPLCNKPKALNEQTLFDVWSREVNAEKKHLLEIRHRHFNASGYEEKVKLREADKESREKLARLFAENKSVSSEDIARILQWDPYAQNKSNSFFDPEWMLGVADGFDLVIGNPPYVYTRNNNENKKIYKKTFGFNDDLYVLFTFKAFEWLKNNGSLTYITPKTYWTIETKTRMRHLLLNNTIDYIFDSASPFAAMVDTCITHVIKKPYQLSKKNKKEDNMMTFYDGRKSLFKPEKKCVSQSIYKCALKEVIFMPSDRNIVQYDIFNNKMKDVYKRWWNKISTSRNIKKNESELQQYQQTLSAGDLTLLGCIADGGQGLATGNNGKYIAVRSSTKAAQNIKNSRPKKLFDAVKKHKIPNNYFLPYHNCEDFIENATEHEISSVFDILKEKYGRDIFSQGYLYKIIEDSEIADVDCLSQDEKENGIITDKPYYVPYDKGDKDGNRWYLETPYAIAWSKENVCFLKTHSGKKGTGMPVVRNRKFYFREGICWSDINSINLKCRLKQKSVNDVVSMSLYPIDLIPDYYIISIINSTFASLFVDSFINNTCHFQINDARQFPIIIPTEKQLDAVKHIFDRAVSIQKAKFASKITPDEAKIQLSSCQAEIDELVDDIYSVHFEK